MRYLTVALIMLAAPAQARAPEATTVEQVRRGFEAWAETQHAPGLVWGIVADGKLVAAGGKGVRDLDAKRPVDADTRFRIASMSKAFTALAILDLRDQGKLSLDAPAETYIPEMRGWKYPTADSPKIRVRDLLNHVAGFVDDNPWGDRQQPLPEADFTKMLTGGVPFGRAPQSAMEYSNFGYATLGRIVTNVSGKPYQQYIRERIMTPLGMTSTGYDIAKSPAGSRAIGYRWENDRFVREPDMADGAFGAMGGVETTANDYAKYVVWLLSAWPARDDPEKGPLKRSTVREIVQGSNFTVVAPRPPALGPTCPRTNSYAMGWQVVTDCDLSYVTHTGGYPGYGSVVMLVPEAGIGVFAFSSRTYGAPSPAAYEALRTMNAAGLLTPRPVPLSPRVKAAYTATQTVWRAGDVMAARSSLAMNFLMDRTAANWKAELARLQSQTGACDTNAPIEPTTAMAGRFTWKCATADVNGSILLAPTDQPTIQELRFTVAPRP
jgi:serine-type D-Ala-D-Ala carboxypeptidase/endopeptidase